MLLVAQPDAEGLLKIISDLFEEKISREEVVAWQRAVQAQSGWDISIPQTKGYWYFYSLALATLTMGDSYFLRSSDLAEYLVDIEGVPGDEIGGDVTHLRSHQIDASAVRWPLAIFGDSNGLMDRLPGVRGTFERRPGHVEHCHLGFDGAQYLVVKEFDENAEQLLLLGTRRGTEAASALMQALAVTDYMLPDAC